MSGLVLIFGGMISVSAFCFANRNFYCGSTGVLKGIGCKRCENTTLTLNLRAWNFHLPITEYLAFAPKNTFKAPYLLTVG